MKSLFKFTNKHTSLGKVYTPPTPTHIYSSIYDCEIFDATNSEIAEIFSNDSLIDRCNQSYGSPPPEIFALPAPVLAPAPPLPVTTMAIPVTNVNMGVKEANKEVYLTDFELKSRINYLVEQTKLHAAAAQEYQASNQVQAVQPLSQIYSNPQHVDSYSHDVQSQVNYLSQKVCDLVEYERIHRLDTNNESNLQSNQVYNSCYPHQNQISSSHNCSERYSEVQSRIDFLSQRVSEVIEQSKRNRETNYQRSQLQKQEAEAALARNAPSPVSYDKEKFDSDLKEMYKRISCNLLSNITSRQNPNASYGMPRLNYERPVPIYETLNQHQSPPPQPSDNGDAKKDLARVACAFLREKLLNSHAEESAKSNYVTFDTPDEQLALEYFLNTNKGAKTSDELFGYLVVDLNKLDKQDLSSLDNSDTSETIVENDYYMNFNESDNLLVHNVPIFHHKNMNGPKNLIEIYS